MANKINDLAFKKIKYLSKYDAKQGNNLQNVYKEFTNRHGCESLTLGEIQRDRLRAMEI